MTSEPPRTVFFLSDFGTEDEFAGVVHAVIARPRPGHDGHRPDASHPALRRPGGEPHLGASGAAPRTRRGARRRRPRSRHGATRHRLQVALPSGASLAFVGPDNGLLVAAAEAAAEAPVARVVELARQPAPPDRGSTFDGRDLFAPAAGRALHRCRARGLGRADRPGVAGPPDRRRRRGRPPARRPRLSAHRGHLGGPVRQPATGGDRGRRPRRRASP